MLCSTFKLLFNTLGKCVQSLRILKNLRLMGDTGPGRTQRWRGMGLLPRVPLAPHLVANHSPILKTESSARKGRPYLLKIPRSPRKSLSFLPQTSRDVQNQEQGGAATVTSTQGRALLGRGGEFQSF